MTSPRFLLRSLLPTALLVGLVLGAGFAPSAVADEPAGPAPKSALEKLSAKELEILAKRIPGWAEMTPEQKEERARGYIAIRDASKEQRKRLLERMQELEERDRMRGRDGSPRRPRRKPSHFEAFGRFQKAVGKALWPELPEETRASIEQAFGKKRGQEAVAGAFTRAVWNELAKARVAAGEYDFEVPESADPRFRRMIDETRRKAAEGDKGAQKRLAHMAVGEELKKVIEKLGRAETLDEEMLVRAGKRFVKRHPEVFAKAMADLQKVAKDPEALKRWAHMGGRHPGGGMDPRAIREVHERAKKLLKALDDAEPHITDPVAQRRIAELRESLKRMLEAGNGRRGPGAMRGPGGRGPGRGPGGMRRPGRHPGGNRRPGPDRQPPPPAGEDAPPPPPPADEPEREPEDR